MKNLLFYITLSICLMKQTAIAQTWNQVTSGTTKDLNCINFPSPAVGYIGGQDSLMLKTIDGGANWQELDMTNFPFIANDYDFVDIQFVTETAGYVVVGPYTGTYKTVNGGLTWTAVDPIYACYNSAVYFFDENNGFLGGAGCFSGEIINKQTNGVWEETNVAPIFIQWGGSVNDFDFWDDSLGLATSTGEYFFRTTDGGTTWDTIPNSLDQSDSLTSVLFHSADTVLATFKHFQTSGFGVLISFDGGLTWQPEMNSATFFYPHMHASKKSSNGRIYIGGQNSFGPGQNPGLIYESNGQINAFWNYESVAESLNGIDSYGDSIVFAVGDNGYIVVNQDVSTLSLEEELNDGGLKLYPNPNSGQFTVETESLSIERITLFNAQGQLVTSAKMKHIKNNKWIINQLKSGIYHVKISTEVAEFTKKVVIF